MNFIEVRSPLKPVGPARHETQHINTSWQDKGIRVDYVRSSVNDRVVNGLYMQHFSWLLISRWLLATGEMKNKFPLQAQTTGSLELKGELHAQESSKKKTNPKFCNPHSPWLALVSPFNPIQDLLVYSNKREHTQDNLSIDSPEWVSALKSCDPAY